MITKHRAGMPHYERRSVPARALAATQIRRWAKKGLLALMIAIATLCAPVGIAQAQVLGAETNADAAPIVQSSFVAAAVRRVGPAVVRIDTERTITRQPNPLFDDPFFRGFFGAPEGFNVPPQERTLQGQGSGFIVDANGDILTNAHVVNDADKVTVTLRDGRTFEGTVEGVDQVTDLAVIRIQADDPDLPVAPMGDSDTIQVGDWAIAVGNPLGLDNTVTLGIISTLKRSSATVGIPNKRLEFIQTDAAINPGNSGGPLLNDRGEVIGINTAIRADAMGIGFAIPINKAKEISSQLIEGKQVDHPYLGVQIATLTPDAAKRNNDDPNAAMILPEVEGVLVVRVFPDTPAAEAGIRRGDVLQSIDGTPTKKAEDLQTLIDHSRVGQRLRVQVRRGQQTLQLSVRAAALEADR